MDVSVTQDLMSGTPCDEEWDSPTHADATQHLSPTARGASRLPTLITGIAGKVAEFRSHSGYNIAGGGR